jgi:cation-dependent mannose-6-phosphate receptor
MNVCLIRLVNTTLEIKDGGLLLRQSQGSPCTGMDDERGSSTILFICDTSVYSAGSTWILGILVRQLIIFIIGKPVLLDQWPSEDDKACHYEFEWRTHVRHPSPLDRLWLTSLVVCMSDRGTWFHRRTDGLLDYLVRSILTRRADAHDVRIRVMILLMAFIVISTLYNRFVLRQTGFNQLPKFTIAHAHEIWDVCSEFIHSLVDYVVVAWNTRTRGFRNVNPASHHWTSRDEEEALRASDPLESEPEDVRGAVGGQDGDPGDLRL